MTGIMTSRNDTTLPAFHGGEEVDCPTCEQAGIPPEYRGTVIHPLDRDVPDHEWPVCEDCAEFYPERPVTTEES